MPKKLLTEMPTLVKWDISDIKPAVDLYLKERMELDKAVKDMVDTVGNRLETFLLEKAKKK